MDVSGNVIVEIHDWKGFESEMAACGSLRSDQSGDEVDILASVKLHDKREGFRKLVGHSFQQTECGAMQ